MSDFDDILGIAADHGGFETKQYLIEKLTNSGYKVKDFGTSSDASVDYPDMIHPIARAIDRGELSRGIIICGSGNGAQITANKYSNVRAALTWSVELAKLAREHNDANILSLPGRFVSLKLSWQMVQTFLNTDFEGGRHSVRVNKIAQLLKK